MSDVDKVTLFVRGQDSSDEDAWDDTVLVKQYDKSLNQFKNKVSQLMESKNEEEDTTTGKNNASNRSKRHQRRPTISWEEGAYCRAKYSADNIDYEAVIVSINKERGVCKVKYIGYGNQEEVSLDRLLPSEGHLARQSQEEQAELENTQEVNDTEDTEEMIPSDSNSKRDDHRKARKKNENKNPSPINRQNVYGIDEHHLGWPSQFPDASSLPPPPPPPPHLFENLPKDDGEALSAMLMSWYMSGYHTGYYYGLKQAKSQQKIVYTGRHHGRWRKNSIKENKP